MKVKVNEIPEEGLTVTEVLDPVKMELETPDVKFTAPVGVKASFHKQQQTVWVEVGVAGQMEQLCGRCLEAFGRDYGSRFVLDYEVEEKQMLDITDDVRQEILLGYPVRTLCREDCRGL